MKTMVGREYTRGGGKRLVSCVRDACSCGAPAVIEKLLPRHKLIQAAAVVLQMAFCRQLLPDFAAKSRWRTDRRDLRFAARQRTVAELRILFQLHQLQALLERLQRSLHLVFTGGHRSLLRNAKLESQTFSTCRD